MKALLSLELPLLRKAWGCLAPAPAAPAAAAAAAPTSGRLCCAGIATATAWPAAQLAQRRACTQTGARRGGGRCARTRRRRPRPGQRAGPAHTRGAPAGGGGRPPMGWGGVGACARRVWQGGAGWTPCAVLMTEIWQAVQPGTRLTASTPSGAPVQSMASVPPRTPIRSGAGVGSGEEGGGAAACSTGGATGGAGG